MPARTRWLVALGLLALLVAPLVAVAASPAARDVVIDFERPGPMRDLLGKSLAVAKGFLFLSGFAAFALEAFGRSPAAGRDYGAVAWRLVVTLFLLWNYQPIFGSVISLMDRLEREVAPESTWQKFIAEAATMRQSLDDLASKGEAPAPDGAAAQTSPAPSRFTTWAYEALVACLQLVGEGLVFLIRWMSRILTATLFILGPLALVAGIPRMSGTATRWFHRFVTIASWPIFSSILLAVMVSLGAQGAARRSYLECLVASLVMLVTALATPTLASHVVGGALQNFAVAGFGHAKSAHKDGVAPAARHFAVVAGGVTGQLAAAAGSVAARFGGGGGSPAGGGGGSGHGGVAGDGAPGRGRRGGAPVANSPDGAAAAGGRGSGRPAKGGSGRPGRGGPAAE